jgi:hypothetical protein
MHRPTCNLKKVAHSLVRPIPFLIVPMSGETSFDIDHIAIYYVNDPALSDFLNIKRQAMF